jgi:[acyl-carrier-protein] S-malonyltransferase
MRSLGRFSTMRIAMFPGQGTQFVGMGRNVYEKNEPFVKDIISKIHDKKGYTDALLHLMMNGPLETLSQTQNCQPSILLHSYLHWKAWEQENIGINPMWMLGHSVGEYMALVASGWLSIQEAFWMVQERGKCMANAPYNRLGMIAVKVPEIADFQHLARSVNVEIANYNSSQWVVLSGELEHLRKSIDTWRASKPKKVLAAKELQVSSAFHSSYMVSPANSFKDIIQSVNLLAFKSPSLRSNKHRFFSSALCKELVFIDQDHFKQYLCDQMIQSVYWYQSVQALIKNEMPQHWIEFGSNALGNLLQQDNQLFMDSKKLTVTFIK